MLTIHLPRRCHLLKLFSHAAYDNARIPRWECDYLGTVTEGNPREIAARVLHQRVSNAYVEDLLERALEPVKLGPADRGLCQELVYGVVRWQSALDWLIARKTTGRQQKPMLQILLRLGLYQVFWLQRIPAHAAVDTTVELARTLGFGPQSGFVNAILRGYLREAEATRGALEELRRTQPHVGYAHPEWLVTRWTSRYGAEATQQLLAWDNRPPATFARVNTLKSSAENLLAQWRSEDVEFDFVSRAWLPENMVFELKRHPPLGTLPSFAQGLFYVQDPSTLLAPLQLSVRPGETVLDLCAAPGGKLTLLAAAANNQCRIVAHDTSPARLKMVAENCTRLGVSGVSIAGNLDEVRQHSPAYDKILIDAPCSNTGVMRRRVDLRWRVQEKEIERLRTSQAELLTSAVTFLKPGGLVVYSTCSLEPEENNELIRDFVATHAELELVSEKELTPMAERCDGAYVARLRRR